MAAFRITTVPDAACDRGRESAACSAAGLRRAASASGVHTIALRCGGWWNDEAFADAVAVYNDPADLLLQFDSSVLK
jgi:hypothetical protein